MRGPQTGLVAILNSKQREGGGGGAGRRAWEVLRAGVMGSAAPVGSRGVAFGGGKPGGTFFCGAPAVPVVILFVVFATPPFFEPGPRMPPATQIAASCLVCRGGANTKRGALWANKKVANLSLVSKKKWRSR
jgi:hypothetical protein